MNRSRNKRVIRFSLVVLLGLAATATPGFHEGGVGTCDGCHISHTSPFGPMVGSYLLLESNSTDTCLRCHRIANGNSWGADLLAPGPVYGGGQFIFLLEDNINDDPSSALIISGNHAGHNVVSMAMGTTPDPVHTTAPGGTYPSSALTCTSCHDPHGRGNHFRFLYGSDYPLSRSAGYEFYYTSPAIEADGIAIDGPPESDSYHTAYRSGVSEWCQNCHLRTHRSSRSGFEHPEEHDLDSEAQNYNSYLGTGDDSGTGMDAYKALVPYEDDQSPGTGDTGPANASSRLMCLSCHRAHASSAPHAGRWDFNINTWADEGALSGSYAIPNPYPLIGPAQETLCQKCHGMEIPD